MAKLRQKHGMIRSQRQLEQLHPVLQTETQMKLF